MYAINGDIGIEMYITHSMERRKKVKLILVMFLVI